MSRAIYVSASLEETLSLCRKHAADVTAAEKLPAGGTRVVFRSPETTAAMTAVFGKAVLTSPARRFPLTGWERRT